MTVERWDQVMYRFESPFDIAEYLVVHYRMAVDDARDAARDLPSPFELTKRGLFVWGTTTAGDARAQPVLPPDPIRRACG